MSSRVSRVSRVSKAYESKLELKSVYEVIIKYTKSRNSSLGFNKTVLLVKLVQGIQRDF